MPRSISCLRATAAAALVLAAVRYGPPGPQGGPALTSARLHVTVVRGDVGRPTPARVYLFKDGKPFRLSPVDVLLPLRVDLHYRERLWRRPPDLPGPDGRPARTLEVTYDGESHFVLLDGEARYELPAGRYRLEAYRGLSWAPASRDFELGAGEDAELSLTLRPLEGDGARGWISGDDHIHLTRAAEDDPTFLRWLEAEDLSVGNFLQLQRQADAAVQYGFGRAAEARAPGYSVRSGEEARSEFYGHVNLLGPGRLVRPLSVGTMYANSPEAYPFPARLFAEGRSVGAVVGYAHFDGSMPHSTLPLDLALGGVDFVEVFQFGELKADRWYELLNAGFRVTGIAGSDFPANLPRFRPWPRAVPLLGPERTLVKLDATEGNDPGRSAYDAWVAGVRRGAVVVSNGPLLDLAVEGRGPGAIIDLTPASQQIAGEARAVSHRALEVLEVVANGRVVRSVEGDGRRTELRLPFTLQTAGSVWVAARVRAQREGNEPVIQAHTSPVYLLRDRRPVHDKAARRAVAERWRRDVDYYRGGELAFADPEQRRDLLARLDEAIRILERDPEPWP
jgi:hypothetical protein